MFPVIVAQWSDWQNGIPPGRGWQGRGAQNPRLLLAFDAVGRAFCRWQDGMLPRSGGPAGGSIHDHPDILALRGGR